MSLMEYLTSDEAIQMSEFLKTELNKYIIPKSKSREMASCYVWTTLVKPFVATEEYSPRLIKSLLSKHYTTLSTFFHVEGNVPMSFDSVPDMIIKLIGIKVISQCPDLFTDEIAATESNKKRISDIQAEDKLHIFATYGAMTESFALPELAEDCLPKLTPDLALRLMTIIYNESPVKCVIGDTAKQISARDIANAMLEEVIAVHMIDAELYVNQDSKGHSKLMRTNAVCESEVDSESVAVSLLIRAYYATYRTLLLLVDNERNSDDHDIFMAQRVQYEDAIRKLQRKCDETNRELGIVTDRSKSIKSATEREESLQREIDRMQNIINKQAKEIAHLTGKYNKSDDIDTPLPVNDTAESINTEAEKEHVIDTSLRYLFCGYDEKLPKQKMLEVFPNAMFFTNERDSLPDKIDVIVKITTLMQHKMSFKVDRASETTGVPIVSIASTNIQRIKDAIWQKVPNVRMEETE